MTTAAPPLPHEIVLVGGGHSHAQVMTAFGAMPQTGLRLTLVTDQLQMPYSGMLPGHVAGLYRRDEMHIDLARLAQTAGTRLVHARACGLDRSRRQVLLEGAASLPYDTLSLNIGIVPDMVGIEGAREHGLAVKPISLFLAGLDALLDKAGKAAGPREIAVVGGGPAGVELAIALSIRLATVSGAFHITLVSGNQLVPGLSAGVRRRVEAALHRSGVTVMTGCRIIRMDETALHAADGRRIPADAALFATAARAPSWLAEAGLPCAADGSVQTRRSLQVLDDDAVFATGDCACVVDDPRPKAGVFAVRQGPVLARNLRAAALGQQLEQHRAQKRFLTLLLSGRETAIAGRGPLLSAEGGWVWHWKDRIDRRFMSLFSDFEGSRETGAG